MNISRTPVWIKTTDDATIFSWIHAPKIPKYNHAFIILGAIGPEYMHTYRSIRLLADRLTETGSVAIRYDPIGMGNSSSNLEEPGIWDKWISTPGTIREYTKTNLNINEFTIIAFRSGSLILESYIKNYSDTEVIFWYPYTHGGAFLRDMEMLDGILNLQDKDCSTLEGGGYPITLETQNELQRLNLLKQGLDNYNNVLIIENGEVSTKSHLATSMEGSCELIKAEFLNGLSALARQAELSVVPVDNIDYICDWVSKLDLSSSDTPITPQLNSSLSFDTFTENVVIVDSSKPIFGVLTLPISLKAPDKLLILTNSGSGHHSGPNRFHVDTARLLATQGIATYRLDLSNLGDSPANFEQDGYHPYPEKAATNLNTVVDFFNKDMGFKNIVMAGLCSGAHNAFHAAIQEKKEALRGLILINVITFYWKPGQSIFSPEENELEINATRYQSNIFDLKKWLGILLTPSKLPRLALFALRLIIKKITLAGSMILSVFGYQKLTQLDRDLNLITSNGVKIHFLYSENEPTYKILMSQAGNTIQKHIKDSNISIDKISNADHTFSSRQSREELVNSIISSVKDII